MGALDSEGVFTGEAGSPTSSGLFWVLVSLVLEAEAVRPGDRFPEPERFRSLGGWEGREEEEGREGREEGEKWEGGEEEEEVPKWYVEEEEEEKGGTPFESGGFAFEGEVDMERRDWMGFEPTSISMSSDSFSFRSSNLFEVEIPLEVSTSFAFRTAAA